MPHWAQQIDILIMNIYMAYEYLTKNSIYLSVSVCFPASYDLTIPFFCWWQVLLCSSSWQSNKIRLSWRASYLEWTFSKADNTGKLSSLYFWGKMSIHHFHIDQNAPCLPQNFHLVYLQVLQSSKEKSKTMVIQILVSKQRALWSMWKWWMQKHLQTSLALQDTYF